MTTLKMLGLTVLMSVAMTSRADDEWVEPEPPTDAEIKKMKVKQLKAFLEDRGVKCNDCVEKNDFQRFVKENKNKPLLPSKRPRKVSKEPIQDQWKKVAIDLCGESGLDEAECKPYWKVVQGSFEMHGRRISKQMHRELHLITKTSLEDPYFKARTSVMREELKWVKKNSIKKQDAIREKIDNKIKMFITECASDNPNPSFEILEKVKKGKHDEL